MRTENVNWLHSIDPHPTSMPNLQRIVDALQSLGANSPENSITIAQLAKQCGIADNQLRNLIINRSKPGIVRVHTSRAVRLYLAPGFNPYPNNYVLHRTTHTPADVYVEDADKHEGIFIAEKPNSNGISSDVAKAYETMAEQKYKDEIARLSDKITHLSKWALPESVIDQLAPEMLTKMSEALSKVNTPLNEFMVASNAIPSDYYGVIALCLIRAQELENR